jgi:hypothetical protein
MQVKQAPWCPRPPVRHPLTMAGMAVRSWDRWGMAVACALLVACSSTVETVADPKVLNLLGFLQSGHVSRNEVEGRMGPPFSTCENDRIVT